MALQDILQGLRIETARHGKLYQANRTRHAALAPYVTATAVLTALRSESPATPAERDAITLALIAEQQAAPHPLWQALLLQAYEPMIKNRLTQLPEGEELEQRTVLAFLESIMRISPNEPPACVALSLKRAVAERVYDPLRRERRTEASQEPLEEWKLCAPSDVFRAAERVEELVDVSRAVAAEPDPDAMRDMLEATVTHGESLQSYVERTTPGATRTERRRVYLRLRADRKRLLANLRGQPASDEKVEDGVKGTEAPTPLMGWGRNAA